MRPILAFTMGDAAGIGAEVCVKALQHAALRAACIPVIIGDEGPLLHALSFTQASLRPRRLQAVEEACGAPGDMEYLSLDLLPATPPMYGQVQPRYGDAAFRYVTHAIDLAQHHRVHAVVTAPLHKEALQAAGHAFAGHTEIFAAYTHATQYAMLLCSGNLRVIHCTTHLSLREACTQITQDRVLRTIRLAAQAMQALGIAPCRIAVAGLNPHAGENGLFGQEELQHILPAVAQARALGLQVEGPLPPDTVFVKAMAGQYDVVVAMYHDQGHIPLKLAGFRMDAAGGAFSQVSGVNCTIGLPMIRTSVDHGTAFDRAGQNRANPQSMIEAAEMACRMAVTGQPACN